MAYAVTGLIGADLGRFVTPAELTGDQKRTLDNALGQQAWGNDGRLYVFVVAGGTIAASQTDISVNASTFAATDGSGAYSGPAVEVLTGTYFWASKASV
jgi:hypothetical protein